MILTLPAKVILGLILALISFLVVSSVSAAPPEGRGKPDSMPKEKLVREASRGGEMKELRKAAAKVKLSQGKLKACEARERNIRNRSEKLATSSAKMAEKFAKISLRVQQFYTDKVLPSGKTVANYDELVASSEAKKMEVKTAILAAQEDLTGFSCTGDDPKTMLGNFNSSMKEVKGALKEYRTSIKNLIVAVHSVTGEANKMKDATRSAKPSQTPEASEEGNI